MTYECFIEEVHEITEKCGQHLHRPILLLLILSDVYRHKSLNYFRFKDYEQRIKDMLFNFGREKTKNYQPQYPFYFLKSSPFWLLDDVNVLYKDAPSRKEMLDTTAKFDHEIYYQLTKNPIKIKNTINLILTECWPSNMHSHILKFLNVPYDILEQ